MSAMARNPQTRQTAEKRRDEVLDAATRAFGRDGYRGASTASIAKLAGISQPYIYALFPSKRDLFLAAHARMAATLRETFLAAAAGLDGPEERLRAMGQAYRSLVEANRDQLLLQMQAHAAAGDPEIGPAVAAAFAALFDDVRRTSGAPAAAVASFFACGMLINVTVALGLPELASPALAWAEAAS